MKFANGKCSFYSLARFILCLGVCVMLGTWSFCGVAFGGEETTEPVTNFNGGPYSKIEVTGLTDSSSFSGAVYADSVVGTGNQLKLDDNCTILTTGDVSSNKMYGIFFSCSDASASYSVTITGGATISVNNSSKSAIGLYVENLTVNTSKKITVKDISCAENASGIKLCNATLDANASDLEINTVSATSGSANGLHTDKGVIKNVNNLTIKNISSAGDSQACGINIDDEMNVNNLEIDTVSGGVMASGIFLKDDSSAISAIINGNLKIKNVTANPDSGLAFAIFNGGTATSIIAGYNTDDTLNGATVQIEGDILSASADPDTCVKLALASKDSYIKGNFIDPDLVGKYNMQRNYLTLKDGGTWYPTVNADNDFVDVVFDSDGVINLNDKDWDGKSVPARDFRTIDIVGNVQVDEGNKFEAKGGVFVINTHLKEGKGDVINLHHATVFGNAKVKVAYDPFYLTGAAGQKVTGEHKFLDLESGKITITAVQTKWTTGDKTIIFTPTVKTDTDGQSWKITALTGSSDPDPKPIVIEASETTKAISDTANAINLAWLENVNNLQKRLGDLRDREESNTGWVRFQRSMNDLNNGRKLNVSGNLYQVGYDFALKNGLFTEKCGMVE